MANFFIRRPIVAFVIAIIIVIMGLFTLKGLSIEQYPFLAPPSIRVTATYPGASAVAVEQSVATPIEQEVNGVDKMIYMKSSNTSDGRMQLDVNFEVGVDQDTANVLTQNRVSSAQARLPQDVVQQGVTVKKQSPSILMLISVNSPKGSYDANFLTNYCGINLRDQLPVRSIVRPDPVRTNFSSPKMEPAPLARLYFMVAASAARRANYRGDWLLAFCPFGHQTAASCTTALDSSMIRKPSGLPQL